MLLHVTEARHLDDYRVYLRFNNGTEGEVDLLDSLDGPVFEPLRTIDSFSRFSLEGHTLAWPNGADFAPEFLLELMCSQVTS